MFKRLLFPLLVALILLDIDQQKLAANSTPAPIPTREIASFPAPPTKSKPSTPTSPNPAPPSATPFPTPRIDLSTYLPPVQAGRTVTVSGENLADKIQAAQDDPKVGTVKIAGGGSITKQVTLRKHTVFDGAAYYCDVEGLTDYGVFLIADNVLVEGTYRPPVALADYFKNGNGRNPEDRYLKVLQAAELKEPGTTIYEPRFVSGPNPAIEVFQALGDSCCSHTSRSTNIAVIGFHIKGRQRVYDGGVRSTILFGNCTHCAAAFNYLEDTGSIGITFGGSALEKGFYANDVVAYRNIFSGVAAANTATINTENAYIFENYVRRPGHHDPVYGGGVCGHDHETNSQADHTKNIWVFNNLYDYEGAARESIGSAICLQDPYSNQNRGLTVAANNVIIGGREDRLHRYLSNGIFLNGLRQCQIINNYVFRTGQNAIQAYGIEGCLIQDQDFESTGGGGNPTIQTEDMVNTVLRRNNFRDRAGLGISTQAGIIESCGRGNTYEQNLTNGKDIPIVSKKPCAKKTP